MGLKSFSRFISILTIISLFFIVWVSVHSYLAKKEADKARSNSFELIYSANDLKLTSDFLTEEIRLYAQTGNEVHETHYLNEVYNIKTREKVIEKLEKLEIFPSEMSIINNIKKLSDSLVPIEERAIQYVKNGELEEARKLLYDDNYIQTKYKMDDLKEEFKEVVTKRTTQEIAYSQKRQDVVNAVFFLSIFLIIFGQIIMVVFVNVKITKPITKISEVTKQLSEGNIDIQLNLKPDKTEIGQLIGSYNYLVQSLKDLMLELDTISHKIVIGQITERGKVGLLKGKFNDVVIEINSIIDSLAKYLDYVYIPITIIDKNFQINYMNKAALELSGETLEKVKETKCFNYFNTTDCDTENCAVKKCFQTGQTCKSQTVSNLPDKSLEIEYVGIPIFDENNEVVGALEFVIDLTENNKSKRRLASRYKYQTEEVEKIISSLELLAKGSLNLEYVPGRGDEFTEDIRSLFMKISKSIETSSTTIKSYIKELSNILGLMANKDLTTDIEREYMGDFKTLKDSINVIVKNLNETFSEIISAASQVENASQSVANESITLAQSASDQASAVQEINSIISTISQQTSENAESAAKVRDFSAKAKKDVENGNRQIAEMVEAMQTIKASSNDIANIIKVIDDIAFQTNLLALNAAVEAARAGVYGKGFAVVAEEVRNLATRSASAAKETAEMIDSSLAKVENGALIAFDTKDALAKVAEGISSTVDLASEIAQSSSEQATTILQIEHGTEQISKATLSTSAAAEESAATSEEMTTQAYVLKDMVSRFKLK